MADHFLVEQVIGYLADWDQSNAPQPVFIDRDDSESGAFNGRQVSFDLTESHVASVASTPDRQTTPIGAEYDHRVEDGVNVRLEGAHVDRHGTISGANDWQAVTDEAKRLVLRERTSYPTVNGTDYHTVIIDSQNNRSRNNKDYFRYDFDVIFRGYEELP